MTLRFLDQLLDILRVAQETGEDPVEAARAFYRVSELFDVPWIRQTIFEAARDDRWEQRAAQALVEDLTGAHHRLAASVMHSGKESEAVRETADRLLVSRDRGIRRFRDILEELKDDSAPTLSGLSVLVREMAALAENVQGR